MQSTELGQSGMTSSKPKNPSLGEFWRIVLEPHTEQEQFFMYNYDQCVFCMDVWGLVKRCAVRREISRFTSVWFPKISFSKFLHLQQISFPFSNLFFRLAARFTSKKLHPFASCQATTKPYSLPNCLLLHPVATALNPWSQINCLAKCSDILFA